MVKLQIPNVAEMYPQPNLHPPASQMRQNIVKNELTVAH